MKCQQCFILTGKHIVYLQPQQEQMFCCSCFDQQVDDVLCEVLERANKVMVLFEKTQNQLNKLEMDLKLSENQYNNLIGEFQQWLKSETKFKKLRKKSSKEKN